MNALPLYLLCLLIACAVTGAGLPLLRRLSEHWLSDVPFGLKTHTHAVPAAGGCAIFLGLAASLVFIRCTTSFPTGTLHSLRGILLGGTLIFILGLIDDIHKPKGLSVRVKLFGQALAAALVLLYGVRIDLFSSPLLSALLTFFWIIGVTNALNLLDIADGLCAGTAAVCALGLWVISLPSEQIYVNFCACALLGACIAFLPYNFSAKYKTFLGDSGSTLLGFILASLAVGGKYSTHSAWGFLAPLLILAVPLFDTAFVSLMRLLQGKNPLLGSDDHAALRLRRAGLAPRRIWILFIVAGILFNALALAVTYCSSGVNACIYMLSATALLSVGYVLARTGGHP